MVVALREAGDDGSAHRAGAGEDDREASAVDGVVREGEAVAGFDGFAVALEDAANRIRAAGEAADGVALAANPVSLAGRRAGSGGGGASLSARRGASRRGRRSNGPATGPKRLHRRPRFAIDAARPRAKTRL